MKYLLSNKFKKPGWVLLIIGITLGILHAINNYEYDVFRVNVISLFHNDTIFSENNGFISIIKDSIIDELISIMIIVGGLLVGFSKEKIEDEFIARIRLNSLKWAILVNYGVLLFATLFLYHNNFLNIMIYNMFTPLLIFILRFNYVVYKKTSHEE